MFGHDLRLELVARQAHAQVGLLDRVVLIDQPIVLDQRFVHGLRQRHHRRRLATDAGGAQDEQGR